MGGLLMGLSIPYEAIIAYVLGLVLLYVVGYLLLVPFKMVLRFIYNGLLGGLMLWGLNVVGGFFGVNIAINFVTALIAGFLGIPGIILLLILQMIL